MTKIFFHQAAFYSAISTAHAGSHELVKYVLITWGLKSRNHGINSSCSSGDGIDLCGRLGLSDGRQPQVNSLPSPGCLRIVILPPCRVTMPCTIESPRPVPSPTSLGREKGSKTRSTVASSMPQPVSAIDKQTAGPASSCGRIDAELPPQADRYPADTRQSPVPHWSPD